MVLYVDNVALPRLPPDAPPVRASGEIGTDHPVALINPCFLSLASFAVRYDVDQKLFYVDLIVAGGFFGWIKLALYRHQPHSVDGCHLSAMPTSVYASVAYDDPIVHQVEDDRWLVTIGPVFDTTVSYRARTIQHLGNGVVLEQNKIDIDVQAVAGTGQRYFFLRAPLSCRGKLMLVRCKAEEEQRAITL